MRIGAIGCIAVRPIINEQSRIADCSSYNYYIEYKYYPKKKNTPINSGAFLYGLAPGGSNKTIKYGET